MRLSLLTPLKVGLLLILGIGSFIWYAQQVSDVGLDEDESFMLYAFFDDATGLAERGLVTIAGVKIGQIRRITLKGSKARVKIRLRNDVEVHADATISKRFESILGDAVLELALGSTHERLLKDGEEIRKVIAVGGVDAILAEMEFTAQNVREVTDTLRRLMGSGEGSLLSIVENVDKISARAESIVERVETTVTHADQIAVRTGENLEQISQTMVGFTDETNASFRNLLAEAELMAEQLRNILQNVDSIVALGEGEVRTTTAQLRDTLERVEASVASIQDVAEKVNTGEGTLGRLINDDKLINTMETSLEDVSLFVGQLAKIQTRVDMRSELVLSPGGRTASKNVFGLEIAPRKDKFYFFELVDDPRGHRRTERVARDVNGQTDLIETTTTTGQFKLTAQFAKRYYFTTLRLGLMENTGGLGMDLHFFDDDLKVRTDFFDLEGSKYPRLRVYGSYTFLDHVYLAVGMDDMFNESSVHPFGRTYLFSGGLRFTDDDLRALIGTIPLP